MLSKNLIIKQPIYIFTLDFETQVSINWFTDMHTTQKFSKQLHVTEKTLAASRKTY